MRPEITRQLLELNQQFYQSFAGPFSETRRRLQPGVARLLEKLPSGSSILDLGCGAGALAVTLAARGWRGSYLGLDTSEELLAIAREGLQSQEATAGLLEKPDSYDSRRGGLDSHFALCHADLADPDWEQVLPPEPFDVILAFAVLHHIPDAKQRLRLGKQVRAHIASEGQFFLSTWQFLNSPRLRDRIQPWDRVGIDLQDVEAGDYLLDWQRGGTGLRYVHQFTPAELETLARHSGFSVKETFYSDGHGGRLGLYQVWAPANHLITL